MLNKQIRELLTHADKRNRAGHEHEKIYRYISHIIYELWIRRIVCRQVQMADRYGELQHGGTGTLDTVGKKQDDIDTPVCRDFWNL